MATKKVLIAGASGLVGSAAVRQFAQLPDWEVVGVSRRTPSGRDRATFVSVDLTDQRRCAEVFSRMTDVTHVVYAAVNEKPGLEEGWKDREQMRLNLSMLENLFGPTVPTWAGSPYLRGNAPHAISMRISTGYKKIIYGRVVYYFS